MEHRPVEHHAPGLHRAHVVQNAFVARTSVLLSQPWDERQRLMEQSVADSERGAQNANDTIEALETITQGARSIVDMTTQVASATEEQASVAAEVTRNVETISNIIEEATGQTEQNAQASQTVAEQANSLQQIMSSFKS